MSKGWSSLDLSEGKLILPYGDITITGPAASVMYQDGSMYVSNGIGWSGVTGYSNILDNGITAPHRANFNILTTDITPLYDDGYSTTLDLTQLGGMSTGITGINNVTITTSGTQSFQGTGDPTIIGGYSTTILYSFTSNYTTNNISSVTLNIDGNGAHTIVALSGGRKVAVSLSSGITYLIYWDGINFVTQSGKTTILYDNLSNPIIYGYDANLYFNQQLTSGKLSNYLSSSSPYGILAKSINGQVITANINYTNTLFVDLNGINSTWATNNPLQPYATITGANAYISPGPNSLIRINNGQYTNDTGEVSPVFKNNVNYYLETGAIVGHSGVETETSGAVIINILGFGQIWNQLEYSNSGSIINIVCQRLYCNGDNILQLSNCTITITCDNIISGSTARTIACVNLVSNVFNIKSNINITNNTSTADCKVISISGGTGTIVTDNIIGYSDLSGATAPVLGISGACGDIYIKANELAVYTNTSTTTPTLTYDNMIVVTNSTGTVTIDIGTIYGGINLQPTGSGQVKLIIKNKLIANISAGNAVTIGAGAMISGIIQNQASNTGSNALYVASTDAIVKDLVTQGGAYSVSGASSYNLIVAGVLSTDTAKNSNITIIGGTYNTNSNYNLL